MTKVEEYRARARECELRASQVHDLEVRQQLLDLARQWDHMAAQWAELLVERGREAASVGGLALFPRLDFQKQIHLLRQVRSKGCD